MRIAAIGFTRNEAEILEPFVRHHCTLVDQITFIVHRCSDNTSEILDKLIQEGLPVRRLVGSYSDGDVDGITRLASGGFLHTGAALLTDLMRDRAQDDADWVIPLDLDEVVAVTGRAELEQILSSANPEAPITMRSRTYVPTPEDDQAEPHLLRRIVFRRDAGVGAADLKIIVPRATALREELMLASGSHCLIDPRTAALIGGQPGIEIPLAHFPVRDEWQIRNRVISTLLMVLASPQQKRGGFFAARTLWKRCVDATPIGRAELQAIAMNYDVKQTPAEAIRLTRDPVPVLSDELRYDVRRIPTWDLLVESAEHLANRLGLYSARELDRAMADLLPGERVR